MANNKYSESIEDKAFKALDEALQIDFSQQKAPSRGAKTPDAPEAKVSDTPSARSNQQDQDESQRRRGRGSRAEQVARAPALAAANDANRMTAASILKSLDGGSTRSAVRNATLFSLLWIVGGVGLMALLYSPQIWQIRSVTDLAASRRHCRHHRHHRAGASVLCLCNHDLARSGYAQRRPLHGGSGTATLRTGNDRIRTHHDGRPSRSP
ncbi:hypothetical protein AJ87_20165 [Rhizobium yanglingense]|nr:hypothetical protein AJ87_20165 [Rhizobium yanglingense]